MRRSKQELVAWARSSSWTRASFSYSGLGETSSFGREWQYSPLLRTWSRNTTQNNIQECKQASFIRSKISFKHPKTFNKPKTWRNDFKSL